MNNRRWLNNTQPQTLQIAVLLLYLNAAFLLIQVFSAGGLTRLGLLLFVGQAAGAFGIANERKWGYMLAVVMACLPLLLLIRSPLSIGGDLLTVMFEVALVALLLHPQSRSYQRIWFK
ncbi:MAG TPA: hypothetical protein VFH45_12545 [Acidimicrobiales bacterium]|nr:hypothetical protein [Acidimicrobiales bacterium]